MKILFFFSRSIIYSSQRGAGAGGGGRRKELEGTDSHIRKHSMAIKKLFMKCVCSVLKLSEKGGQEKKLHIQYDCAYKEKVIDTLT